jgi:hypothetical protein
LSRVQSNRTLFAPYTCLGGVTYNAKQQSDKAIADYTQSLKLRPNAGPTLHDIAVRSKVAVLLKPRAATALAAKPTLLPQKPMTRTSPRNSPAGAFPENN